MPCTQRQAADWQSLPGPGEAATNPLPAGDPGAKYDLGLCLAHGIGVSRDDHAALDWISRSAKDGYPDATRMLEKLTTGA